MLRDSITLPKSLGHVNENNEISCKNLFRVAIKHDYKTTCNCLEFIVLKLEF